MESSEGQGNGLSVSEIARVCHEANRAYCDVIGDDTQPEWSRAPKWQTDSAINGVRFHMEHPEAGDAASHNNWLDEKRADGWKYGPVKDADKKEHPCMVAFEDLPRFQQVKDRLFRSIVHAFM